MEYRVLDSSDVKVMAIMYDFLRLEAAP